MTQMPYAYQKRWRLDVARGRHHLVPAQRVTTHVRSLLAAGMSMRGIARAAQVGTSTVARFRDEEYPTAQRDVARRLLAVNSRTIIDRPDRAGFVPNLGARRRIRALLALGWTHADITAHMDGTGQRSQVVLHQEGRYVTKAAHDAVCAAYDALSMKPGPSTVTRRRAAASGYAPPLAWDDETIDNPNAQPHGHDLRTEHLDLDEFMWLVRAGETAERAAERCGVTLSAVERAAYRRDPIRRDAIAALGDETRRSA